jgi:antitoxin component YwqK of YwqJK toxin-antitoxin module
MKLWPLIILILGTFLVSCNNKKVNISELELNNNVYYHNSDLKPFTGICYTKFPGSNKIKSKRTLKDGILHGEMIVFFPDGDTCLRGYYKNGAYDGKWVRYYENGQKAFEVHHSGGLLDGKYRTYYENGQLKDSGLYTDNKRVGDWKSFTPSGKTKNIIVYKN